MLEPAVLYTRDLTVRFGGHVAVNAVTADFHRGSLTAIVGPNGAGKTTYFNVISGQIPAYSGSAVLNGEEITSLSVAERTHRGLGRAFQLTNLFPNLSVLENVRLVVQSHTHSGFDLFSRADGHQELIDKAEHYLARVNLLDAFEQPVSNLPHGDQRKLEVALLLALGSDVLMFDEPTAGMSVDEVPVVLDLIKEIKADKSRTILLVEHKMDVIHALADRIIVLHNGTLVAEGEPREVMQQDVVQQAYLGNDPDAEPAVGGLS